MKKNLLLYGVFLCALSISSCSGGSKSSHVMDSSSMSVENANEVMKYYDTSLKILKDLVNENEIKAVLGYLDQKMPVDSLFLSYPPKHYYPFYMIDPAYTAGRFSACGITACGFCSRYSVCF